MDARSPDPRSLVGMTMGARKRKAYRYLLEQDAQPHRPDEAAWFVRSLQFRASLRIGERLRPCPGCEECQGWDVEMGLTHCDGSGTRPAHRSPAPRPRLRGDGDHGQDR